jgi:hypothetical protein
MEKTTQLSIPMENTPGQLGRLCRVLTQADVNIRGISICDAADVSTVRLIVSDPAAAKKALREAGLQFVSQDVLVLELNDKPGALEKVALRLGEAGINISYLYGTGDGAHKGVMVLRVSDVDRARQTLAK